MDKDDLRYVGHMADCARCIESHRCSEKSGRTNSLRISAHSQLAILVPLYSR